jgi:hypothetical protein
MGRRFGLSLDHRREIESGDKRFVIDTFRIVQQVN